MDKKYLEAIEFLSPGIAKMLKAFPDELQNTVREVCIKADKPICILTLSHDGIYFLKNGGGFSKHLPISPYIAKSEDVFDCIRVLTGYSIHSCKAEMNGGFITIKGGHRAGIAGSCVYDDGKIEMVSNISSINLRIARQIKGVATELVRKLYSPSQLPSLLIAGPPASGKTTLLRDISRCLSSGIAGIMAKVSLIDERGEIAAVYNGVAQNDVGILTDIFDGYKKGDGMALAIRSMSPQIVILDEISGDDDAFSITQSLNTGVGVIASVHASSIDELYRKKSICDLLKSGGFSNVVMLKSAQRPCEIAEIFSQKDLVLC